MKFYGKLIPHVGNNGFAKLQDLLTCCSAPIHQHQSLLGMNPCTPQRATLPATLFYQPSGRNFNMRRIDLIERHRRIAGSQILEMPPTNDRVHEEATGVAFRLRVGKF